jgi:hypothetical protein
LIFAHNVHRAFLAASAKAGNVERRGVRRPASGFATTLAVPTARSICSASQILARARQWC